MYWWTSVTFSWGCYDLIIVNLIVFAVVVNVVVADSYCGYCYDCDYDDVYNCSTISSSAQLTPIKNATLFTLSHYASPPAYSQTCGYLPTLTSSSIHYYYYHY